MFRIEHAMEFQSSSVPWRDRVRVRRRPSRARGRALISIHGASKWRTYKVDAQEKLGRSQILLRWKLECVRKELEHPPRQGVIS